MHKGHYATGVVTGTGAALNVICGFVPEYVRIINADALATGEWLKAMGDGAAIKQVTAGTLSEITTGGITPYEGTRAGDGAGFTIGNDANLNGSGQAIHWVAVSSDS